MNTNISAASSPARRHDLDWLRVWVFALLIFYHVGMLYVADWGFHYKSNYQAEWLQSLMILVNQWRLPLLFLISGIAMRLLLKKVSLKRFIAMRTLRLWVPLMFGIWVVVPPQLYVEMMANGDLPAINYHEFYRAFFDLSHPYFESYQSGIFPHVDVNHLWYIRELWFFSMYLLLIYGLLSLLLLMPYLYRPFSRWRLSVVFMGLVLVMSVLQTLVFPPGSEGTRMALGFSFLCWGFLIGTTPRFWHQLATFRRHSLALALLSFTVLISYYHSHYGNGGEAPSGFGFFVERLLVFTNRWAWIFAILGYAHHHLNRPHPWLRYLNEAVYPYYILHQTFIIVAAYLLSSHALGPVAEPMLVIGLTFVGCAVGFEVIRRSAVLRLLFGLKIEQPINNRATDKKTA